MALTSCTPPSGDSNTTPVTLDTTDTTVSLPHSSSCRRLLKVTSAATKKIGRVIGIPGVSQVAEMAGQLIQQTSSEHHGEIANLGAHLGGILDIVNSDHSLLKRQLAESSRNLESMYRQVDEMRHSDRPLNAFRARERIEELERLSKQTEHWADRQILTHLLMQDLAAEARHIDLSSQLESIVNLKFQTEKPPLPSTRSPAPELENFPEDKIPAIDLDSIKGQEVELSYMAIDEHPCSEHCSYMCVLTHSESRVRVTCTTGLLHGVRVMRKSYNSPDQAIATRLAKRDLVSLSKYIHPNYASLKGVARDIHGQVRDIVMTTAPIAWQMFVERVDDPAAVARYMKGVLELRELESMSRWNSLWMKGAVQIQVHCNGHVTAIPAAGISESPWSWFDPKVTRLSPTARNILKIFFTNKIWPYKDPQSLLALHRFIDSVSQLHPGFTPFDLFKVAADAIVAPTPLCEAFTTDEPPSPPFSVKDFVVMENSHCVRVFENRPGKPAFTGWYTDIIGTKIPVCWKWGQNSSNPEPWDSFRTKVKQLSQSHNIPLHQIRRVHYIGVGLTIKPARDECYISDNLRDCPDKVGCDNGKRADPITCWPRPLYFHRRPASKHCPREFWGFFSTSSDPYEQCPEFPPGTNRIEYKITYGFDDMSRDYSYRYERMVNDGLKAMPGSFSI